LGGDFDVAYGCGRPKLSLDDPAGTAQMTRFTANEASVAVKTPVGGTLTYRDAWTVAGHDGRGKVMLAFHMYCADTSAKAAAIAREPLNQYLKSIVDAASGWMAGVSSRDYPNYQKMIESLARETFESQVEKSLAWIGTPEEIRSAIESYDRGVGGFESASLQVNFGMIGRAEAEASMLLFAREVMPHFA